MLRYKQMFVSQTATLSLCFTTAVARLGTLARGDGLLPASLSAYGESITGYASVGPVPGLSRIVRVHAGEPFSRAGSASFPIRWQAEGPGDCLFPVLDADILVERAGSAAILRLDGVYRPPLGPVGSLFDHVALHSVAEATIRRFLSQVAGLLTSLEPGALPEPTALSD